MPHSAFFIGLAVAWAIAWFAFIAPRLRAYQRTAGVMAELDAGEHSLVSWLGLRLRGLKTVLLLFLTSIATGASSGLQGLFGLDPTALAPFQESTLWKALLRDEMAIKAAALATFASALLVLHGKLRDVAIVPQAGGAPAAPAPNPGGQ